MQELPALLTVRSIHPEGASEILLKVAHLKLFLIYQILSSLEFSVFLQIYEQGSAVRIIFETFKEIQKSCSNKFGQAVPLKILRKVSKKACIAKSTLIKVAGCKIKA